MKLIYSLYLNEDANREYNNFCGFNTKEDLLDCFYLSYLNSIKIFDIVEFYCSTDAERIIIEDGRFTKMKLINCLDQFSNVRHFNWAITKIYVYQLQKEPFIHLDIDAIIWKKIPNYLLENTEMIFQQYEYYDCYHDIYNECKNANILPNFIKEENNFGLNCAVFGAFNNKCFDMIKEYYQAALDWCELNPVWVDSNIITARSQSIFFEQYFLTYFLKKYNIRFNTILNENQSMKIGVRYTHLIIFSKRKPEHIESIRSLLKNIRNV